MQVEYKEVCSFVSFRKLGKVGASALFSGTGTSFVATINLHHHPEEKYWVLFAITAHFICSCKLYCWLDLFLSTLIASMQCGNKYSFKTSAIRTVSNGFFLLVKFKTQKYKFIWRKTIQFHAPENYGLKLQINWYDIWCLGRITRIFLLCTILRLESKDQTLNIKFYNIVQCALSTARSLTRNDRTFVCPIICTDSNSQCYFVH